MYLRVPAFLLAGLLCLACAPKVNVDNPSPFDEEDPAAGGTRTNRQASAIPVTSVEPAVAVTTTGTVTRADLVTVLDAGPAAFLAGLEISAEFTGNRFAGWRIVQFFSRASPYAGVDLRPGDIVRTVNNRRIERPNHLQLLWKELRKATEIHIEAERGGQAHTLRFTVLDAA